MSYYSFLGGSTPYTSSQMQSNIVDDIFGKGSYDVISMWDPGYEDAEVKIRKTGEIIYRSSNYQGFARLSPCKKFIHAHILIDGGIEAVIYVKK